MIELRIFLKFQDRLEEEDVETQYIDREYDRRRITKFKGVDE